MTMIRWVGFLLIAQAALPAAAQPGRYHVDTNKYQVTDLERAACEADAILHCSSTFPDEEALLVCMKASRLQLTKGCRSVFEAGLQRRHIPF